MSHLKKKAYTDTELTEILNRVIGDMENKKDYEGKITEVAEITDIDFLSSLSKQCGLLEEQNLAGRVFIISSTGEQGKENFDIAIRNDAEGKYEHLAGIKNTGIKGREILVKTNRMIPGVVTELDKVNSLSEFTTKSGHRYAITSNSKGKLGFIEILVENEAVIQGQYVDAFTFSAKDLIEAYEDFQITQGDLKKAFESLNRSKNKRKQTDEQSKKSEFEGR